MTQVSKKVLVTGGAGYIGSQVVRELLKNSYEPVVVDNLSVGVLESVPKDIPFFNMDIRNQESLRSVFKENSFLPQIH